MKTLGHNDIAGVALRAPRAGTTGERIMIETKPPEELPAVLTVDEVAELLRVDRKTVYEQIARGELPGARRVGRAIRISRDAVIKWLAEGQGRVPRSRR
jgi:excisionase family DNA binding protein